MNLTKLQTFSKEKWQGMSN